MSSLLWSGLGIKVQKEFAHTMSQKQEVSDILNMAMRIKTNTTNQTGDITNSAVANVCFLSSCSTKSGAFNFHSCTNVNIIFITIFINNHQ